MNRRQAHLIRCGILAARDPERRQYVHLAPRLVREACRREMENIVRRERREAADAYLRRLTDLLRPTGDPVRDAANRASFVGETFGIPQRVWLGVSPPPVRPPNVPLGIIEDLRRRMAPSKPIPDTFKAAPSEPPKTFTTPAWHLHHTTPHTSISDAVARKARTEQAEHLRRFYA